MGQPLKEKSATRAADQHSNREQRPGHRPRCASGTGLAHEGVSNAARVRAAKASAFM